MLFVTLQGTLVNNAVILGERGYSLFWYDRNALIFSDENTQFGIQRKSKVILLKKTSTFRSEKTKRKILILSFLPAFVKIIQKKNTIKPDVNELMINRFFEFDDPLE